MQQRQGGRPLKKVPKGERTQIGVIVGGKTKSLLLKSMKESGRTISREAEHLIEKALMFDDWLAAFKKLLTPSNGDSCVIEIDDDIRIEISRGNHDEQHHD